MDPATDCPYQLTSPFSLRLPLHRRLVVTGAKDRAQSQPFWTPAGDGIVLSYGDRLELRDPGLKTVRWAKNGLERAAGLSVGGRTYLSPTRRADDEPWRAVVIDSATGDVLAEREMGLSTFVGTEGQFVVARLGKDADFALVACDSTDLREVWRRQGHSGIGIVVSANDRLLVPSRFGASVECVDAATGTCLWTFRPPGGDHTKTALQNWNRIGTGPPSIVIAKQRLIVSTLDGHVYSLSLDTGELIRSGQPPFVGAYLVTESSVFVAKAFGLSEFNHGEMREVDRIEYRSEVEPLFKGHPPTAYGLCLSEESIVWPAAHGALMGVSRKVGAHGKRVAWLDEIPGAVIPMFGYPVCRDRYLYYSALGLGPDAPSGLYCYEGAVQ